MSMNNNKRRQSTRLRGYDYSQPGSYFITVCAKDKECLFGEIRNGKMIRNEFGKITISCWNGLMSYFPNVNLDAFIVMPNHMHGIVELVADVNVGARLPRPYIDPGQEYRSKPRLGQTIAYFKYQSTKHINILRGTPGLPVWQRNYHDHVIEDDKELRHYRFYTRTNPRRWDDDEENPENNLLRK